MCFLVDLVGIHANGEVTKQLPWVDEMSCNHLSWCSEFWHKLDQLNLFKLGDVVICLNQFLWLSHKNIELHGFWEFQWFIHCHDLVDKIIHLGVEEEVVVHYSVSDEGLEDPVVLQSYCYDSLRFLFFWALSHWLSVTGLWQRIHSLLELRQLWLLWKTTQSLLKTAANWLKPNGVSPDCIGVLALAGIHAG